MNKLQKKLEKHSNDTKSDPKIKKREEKAESKKKVVVFLNEEQNEIIPKQSDRKWNDHLKNKDSFL